MAESPEAKAGSASQNFECNICFDEAKEPVVTRCGHLYCWPCILSWLEHGTSQSQECPVCKAGVSKDNVIPLYARGGDSEDPRKKRPHVPRPQAERPEAARRARTPLDYLFGFGNGEGGANIEVNVGMFPFFGFNMQQGGGTEEESQDFRSKCAIVAGLLILYFLIF